MDERNNLPPPDEQREPVEIPLEGNEPEIKPIRASASVSRKKNKKSQGIKIAYAITIILALGSIFTSRLIAEQSLSDLNSSTPSGNTTLSTNEKITIFSPTEDLDFEVRNNLTDVPDTREETKPETTLPTEPTTEKDKHAIPYKDYYTLPLSTDISGEYSPMAPVYNPTLNVWRTHPAIDFSGPDGSQILAIAYGTVTNVYEDALYGTVIEIDHGNEVIAKYCGFNKDTLEVKTGDTVENGSLLGYLGTVPCEKTQQSHLHFEMYYKGKAVEPLELMGK